MIKAVLLDLDNTLLRNPDRAFASAFMQHFQEHFSAKASDTNAAGAFRNGIKLLASTNRIGQQNNSTLLENALINANIPDAATILKTFYEGPYKTLQGCIQPVEGANELIQTLQERGYAIVIATNPLYPVAAIQQRMDWGHLPTDPERYTLITGAEVMHFGKPDAAYYAEILGRIGIEPDEALMIGDSQRNDILPAQTLSIRTCHISSEYALQRLVDELDDYLEPAAPSLQPPMIAPQLRGNIGALNGFLDTVQDDFWQQRPVPNEWSILQILCHLVDAEQTSERPRLEKILHEDNPFITAPPEPGPDIAVCDEDGFKVANQFLQQRQQTLKFLDTLTETDWKRRARHSIFGLTTLLEMAHFTAQHDRLHLNQLCQTIGRCK